MPHPDNLKKQAKQIVRWHREGYYPVAQRIRTGLPHFNDIDDATILSKAFTLSDAARTDCTGTQIRQLAGSPDRGP